MVQATPTQPVKSKLTNELEDKVLTILSRRVDAILSTQDAQPDMEITPRDTAIIRMALAAVDKQAKRQKGEDSAQTHQSVDAPVTQPDGERAAPACAPSVNLKLKKTKAQRRAEEREHHRKAKADEVLRKTIDTSLLSMTSLDPHQSDHIRTGMHINADLGRVFQKFGVD